MRLEHRTASTSGGEISYVEYGEGPPVVLLHGFPTSSHLWRNVIPLLGSRFRTVAPDLIGYGRSAKPADRDLDIRAQARYVGELLAHLGIDDDQVTLVGHDLGGGVAQLLAFGSGGPALVLIDSITFDSWPIEGVRMLQRTPDEQATEELAENVVRVALRAGTAKTEPSEDLVRAYAEPFSGTDGPAALLRAVRAIDGEGLQATEGNLAAFGDRLLAIWGEEDPYQEKEWAYRLSDAVPGSAVAMLPGCSHYVMEDAPETVGPLLYEWLRVRVLNEPGHRAGDVSLEPGMEPTFERPPPDV